MGRRRDTPDFTRSNKITYLAYVPTKDDCTLTQRLIESSRSAEREALGQRLIKSICGQLKIQPARLRVFDDRQPHKMREGKLAFKEYGAYHFDDHTVAIANLTAVREQVVAGKTFFDTLVHELMHHIDRKHLRIPSTPHSPGFYARIDDLKRKLMAAPEADYLAPEKSAPWSPPPENLATAFELAAAKARQRNVHPPGKKPKAPENLDEIPPEKRRPRWTSAAEPKLFSAPPAGESSPAARAGRDKKAKSPERGEAAAGPKSPAAESGGQKSSAEQLALDFQEPLFTLDKDS